MDIDNRSRQELVSELTRLELLYDTLPIMIWEEDWSDVRSALDELIGQGVSDFDSYFSERPEELERFRKMITLSRANETSLKIQGVKSLDQLQSALDEKMSQSTIRQVFKSCIVELSGESRSFKRELAVMSAEGELQHVLLWVDIPPQYQESLSMVVVSVLVIKEIKEKEQLLLRNEEIIKEYSKGLEQKVKDSTQELLQNEQAQKIAKVGIWEWDLKSDELKWSDQLYDNFDLDHGTAVSIDEFLKYIHPDDQDYVNELLAETKEDGTPQSLKYRIITSKNNLRYMHGMSEQIADDNGNIVKMVGIVQDITSLEKVTSLENQVGAILEGQEMERERIAADLHDSLSPLLSLVGLNLEALFTNVDQTGDYSKEKLKDTIDILQGGMDTLREISANLSPEILKNFGLKKAIDHICNRIEVSDAFKIDFRSFGLNGTVESSIELALYRMVQELIINVVKHAEASEVEIQLVKHSTSIVLMVRDNGKGFNESVEELMTNGFGFKNIVSRAQALKGTFNIDSTKGVGTTVTIEIPT